MPALMPEMTMGENGVGSYQGDEIVISGISGRLPESSNIEEFKENLMNHVDMVTDAETRWARGLHGLPARNGKLKDLSKFDASFFGVHPKQATHMDPQLRLLLEVTYEAIVDAGVNIQDVRGTRTGVFVGVSTAESEDFWQAEPDKINGYGLTGCCKAMFANRISFTFNFTGPSFAVDTACSSSMLGLQQAMMSIRSGNCDAAIVAGTNLVLKPTTSLQFHRLSMLSPEGKCQSFDSSGNGYVRSESVVAIYLQKSKDAKRMYATIINSRTNVDGAKEQGITFPSGVMQKKLIEEVYEEARISPLNVSYIEAHGTGTKVGDPQEVNSIAEVFCKGRTSPLLIGSVKSNMGHSEAGSGLCSVAKVLIAMESGYIPANLHFKTPNSDIPALADGRLQVVDKNWPWNGGYAAINSFGFGGANVHVLLKSNPKPKLNPVSDDIPKLIAVSGRTSNAVTYFIDKVESMPRDDDLLHLIHGIHNKNIPGHMHRGYAVLGDETKRETAEQISEKRQVWYVFSGMGSQWLGMGKELMVLEPFSKAINKCASVLTQYGVDLLSLIMNPKLENLQDNMLNSFVCIAAMQVALVDVLTCLGITPDGILGHSVGELGCAYADGTFTAVQTVLAAYWRGRCITEGKLQKGKMVAIGLSWEETLKRLPKGVEAACHNAKDSVTISGPVDLTDKFIKELEKEEVFVRQVNSNGIAFHSQYIAGIGDKLRASLEKVIPVPKPRSKRWLSTSISETGWSSQLASHSSAAYHVNNLLSPVLFYSTLQRIPEDAVVIEIAPHSLLQAILKRSLPQSCFHIPLTKKETGLNFFLGSLGRLYNAGLQPRLDKLYRPVTLPVPRGTPMISTLVNWDHSVDWDVADFSKPARSGECIIEVDINSENDKYISGHTIDGRVLFPATGYMTLIWKTFAKLNQKEYEEFPVVLQDIQFKRATIMPREGSVKFLVNVFDGTGEFEIVENGSTVVTGFIKPLEEEKPLALKPPLHSNNYLPLTNQHIYRELRLRGYDYSGLFQGIKHSDNYGESGELEWKNNWISFMDTMLQFSLIGNEIRRLFLPVRIQQAIIDPKKHLEIVSALPENMGVPVQDHKHIKVVQSGGIEFRGLKASLAPRRQQIQAAPKLEKYSFVPYFSNKAMDKVTAITVELSNVLENCGNISLMKVVEIGHSIQTEALISPMILSILEAEPKLEVDITVLTADMTAVNSVMEPLGIKTDKKDLMEAPLVSKVHCVFTTNLETSKKTLDNINKSLYPGGFLMVEAATLPEKDIMKAGFILVSRISCDLKSIFLFRTETEWKSPRVVYITQKNYDWLDEVKLGLKKCEDGDNLVLACLGEPDCGIVGMFNCIKLEPKVERVRCLFVPESKEKVLSAKHTEQLKKNLVVNILKGEEWGSLRHTLLSQTQESFFKVEHAYINALTVGDLSSLHWIESPLSFYRRENYPDKELCTVYYSALNFRDIMLASGKLPPDSLPGALTGQECLLGFEFAGRDSNGSRVMGIVGSQALATTVLADPYFMWTIPDEWTMEQAATIPVVYATSYYALVARGRMKKGESVLIHAGSGGVGQAAISIALHMGCKVFTTVGSQQKRDFLKNTFPQLSDNQIGNSRDTSFEQLIMTETKGKGVDLVLNSLAGDLLQASVRCLAEHGRFLEIGKFDLSNNTPLGMSIFLKNATFHGVLLDGLFDGNKREIMKLLSEGIASGAVKPLPATTFGINQIEQSFRYMAAGKHIGKVLVKVREEEPGVEVVPKQTLVEAIPRTYMNPDKSYIVVGGLGGFGLEMVEWMFKRGAKHVVLVSRSGITTGYQSLCVRRWKEKGHNVIISTADSTTIQGAKQLISEANSIAPVGGLFNLAGVLRDGLITNQTKENFSTVCRCKVAATKALDEVSRVMCPQLDYFVIFSSLSCGRGNAGQSNYGFANSAMERICEQRQLLGLPAIAVQWGPIGDVGMVIDELGGSNDTRIAGALPQRITSCMASMDYFLQQPHPVMSSVVLAEKRKKAADSSITLTDAVANILGVKDIKSVSAHSSLGDLGMDSLMGAEIKQTLERNFDLILSPQDIRALTFAKLQQISAQGVVDEKSSTSNNEQAQYQGKALIPKDTLIKMKDGGSQTMFLVHPIEGDVSCLATLASQLPYTVWGLQASKDVPFTSIPDCATHYIKEVKSVQKSGPYLICGYSYGACIAFEMALQLEAARDQVRLAMLDGSPRYVTSTIYRMREKRIKDHDSDHANALTYFISLFTNIDYNKCHDELKLIKDSESRIKKCSEKLKGLTPFSDKELEAAAEQLYNKLAAAHSYNPITTYKGNAILLKAESNYINDSVDYGLGSICSKAVKLHTIEGDHRGILKEGSAKRICSILDLEFNS